MIRFDDWLDRQDVRENKISDVIRYLKKARPAERGDRLEYTLILAVGIQREHIRNLPQGLPEAAGRLLSKFYKAGGSAIIYGLFCKKLMERQDFGTGRLDI